MKIDKRIILYLDNQMNEEEKSSFEKELHTSRELSQQLEQVKSAFGNLRINENEFSNEDYFVNLVPKFREQLPKIRYKTKFKPAIVYSSIAAVIGVMFLVFSLFKTNELSIDKVLSDLNELESVELFQYYSGNFTSDQLDKLNGETDSLFSDMIYDELNFEEADIHNLIFANSINVENVVADLKTEEAEAIYNEILNTKFF